MFGTCEKPESCVNKENTWETNYYSCISKSVDSFTCNSNDR